MARVVKQTSTEAPRSGAGIFTTAALTAVGQAFQATITQEAVPEQQAEAAAGPSVTFNLNGKLRLELESANGLSALFSEATQQTAATAGMPVATGVPAAAAPQQQVIYVPGAAQQQQQFFVLPNSPVRVAEPAYRTLNAMPVQQFPIQAQPGVAGGEQVAIPVLQDPTNRLELVYVNRSVLDTLKAQGYEVVPLPASQVSGLEQTAATPLVQVPVDAQGNLITFQYAGPSQVRPAGPAPQQLFQVPSVPTTAANSSFLIPAAVGAQAPAPATQVDLSQFQLVKQGNEYFYLVPYSSMGQVFPQETSLLRQTAQGLALPDPTLLDIASGFGVQTGPLTAQQVADRLQQIIDHLNAVAGLPAGAEAPATPAAPGKTEPAKTESDNSGLAAALRALLTETDE